MVPRENYRSINATGPYLEANPHTLGMIVASAHAIENLLQVKEALAQCQLADTFQKTVFSSIPEALLAVDTQGMIVLINRSTERMFGLKSNEVIGRNINDVLGQNNERFIDIISNNRCIWDERYLYIVR
jgi:PAS domain-containing protein